MTNSRKPLNLRNKLKRITIAIDGYSSTGKSTLAKELAKRLNYSYVDTGAMYRCIALYALNNGFYDGQLDATGLINSLENISISFDYDPSKNSNITLLNNENVEEEIRGIRVSNKVSEIASISEIRKNLVSQQKIMGKSKGVVMDGRDIGTVVFPDAELKIFMTASAEIRAKRRFLELDKKGVHVNYEEILHNIKERDFIDSTRVESPLKKAEDAITLDNSAMSKDEQARLALSWARGVIKSIATT